MTTAAKCRTFAFELKHAHHRPAPQSHPPRPGACFPPAKGGRFPEVVEIGVDEGCARAKIIR
jgi:hypothetical protein